MIFDGKTEDERILKLSDSFDSSLRADADIEVRDFILKHRAEVCGMLDTEYNEEEIRELFMEDGRREERANTEREKARADAEKQRADSLQAKLDAILAKNEE